MITGGNGDDGDGGDDGGDSVDVGNDDDGELVVFIAVWVFRAGT